MNKIVISSPGFLWILSSSRLYFRSSFTETSDLPNFSAYIMLIFIDPTTPLNAVFYRWPSCALVYDRTWVGSVNEREKFLPEV